jgi:hypothetical protein
MVGDEISQQRVRRLEPILEVRKKISESARMRYWETRSWNERIKSLVKDAAARAAELEDRRVQAMLDDRFLARRWWQQGIGKNVRDE